MRGLRIRHLLILVAAAAILFTAVRLDAYDSCTPVSPIVILLYLCAVVGLYGARWQGRSGRAGFWLGLVLGPVGVLLAWSNPIPDRRAHAPGASGQLTTLGGDPADPLRDEGTIGEESGPNRQDHIQG